ncbi:cutinase family protein [Nocardia sp. CA2R105]|uniref:cutinase family protein n=1 Tax=Nocardia coffeae TaxID=2873381 RepID=UPI001CA699F0|nr:cutinase family protein [Nocardia coffeae]MBY8855374.1 cutinase family protein [Nocardia coffeae]
MIGSHIRIRTTRHPARPRPLLRRWAGAALCAATVLTAAVVPGLAVAAPTERCAKVTTVTVPGTWEDAPTGTPPTETAPQTLLAPVTRDLQARYGNDLASQTVDYSASITPTYAASETDGTQALSAQLSQLCPTTKVVLLGYSQGAQVAGDLAARIGHGQGPIPASRVLAVGLVADPHRASTTPQLGHQAGGEGVEGPRAQDFGQLTDRVRTLCAQGDLYCSASPQTDPLVTTIGRAFTSTPNPTSGPEATTQTGPASQPSDAGSALAGLDASTLTQQVLNVLAGMTSLAANLPAIGGDLAALPQRLVAMDVPGTHQLAGDLNNQFRPLVTMASQVDLHLIARILTIVAPADTSGIASAAAQIVDLLAGVDINRAATDLGTAQETAWAAVQKLITGDVLGAGAVLTGLLPVAADLAQVAANALTGSTAAPLAALTATNTGTASNGGLADLARQGIDAANFFSSGVHQNGYASGLQNLTGWLTGRINHAH